MDERESAFSCYHSEAPLAGHQKEHRHRAHQLLAVTQGWMECRVSGILYHLQSPALLIITNFEPHAILAASPDYARYVLTIEPDLLVRSVPRHLASLFDRRPEEGMHQLPASALTPALAGLLEALCPTPSSQIPDPIPILLPALLCLLERAAPDHFSSPAMGDKTRIAESVRRHIEEDLDQPLGLSDLALAHHISPSRLSHLFKEVYGISMREFLTLSRIEKACELLRSTDQTVGQIAEACGFGDLCNFSRCFDRITGHTPTAYRSRMKRTPRAVH